MAGFSRGGRKKNDPNYENHTWINSPNIRHRKCAVCGARVDSTSKGLVYSYPDGTKTSEYRPCTMKPTINFRDDIEVFSSLIDDIMSEYGVTMEDISLSIGNSPGLISRIINRVKALTNFEIEELDKEFNDFNFKEKLRSKLSSTDNTVVLPSARKKYVKIESPNIIEPNYYSELEQLSLIKDVVNYTRNRFIDAFSSDPQTYNLTLRKNTFKSMSLISYLCKTCSFNHNEYLNYIESKYPDYSEYIRVVRKLINLNDSNIPDIITVEYMEDLLEADFSEYYDAFKKASRP